MNALKSLLVVAVAFAFGSNSRADEEKIPLDKVPVKVKEAVKAKFPDAEVVGAEKETDKKGTVTYEINIKNKGQMIDVILTADGKITAVEKVIPVTDVPKVVMEAMEKKYPNAKASKAEEITKDEKVSYELIIKFGEKKLEVVFDDKGKFVEEEDKSKEKEEKK